MKKQPYQTIRFICEKRAFLVVSLLALMAFHLPICSTPSRAAEMATKAALDRAPPTGTDAQEAAFAAAEIRTAGFVTEYVIPGRVSILAAGP